MLLQETKEEGGEEGAQGNCGIGRCQDPWPLYDERKGLSVIVDRVIFKIMFAICQPNNTISDFIPPLPTLA